MISLRLRSIIVSLGKIYHYSHRSVILFDMDNLMN